MFESKTLQGISLSGGKVVASVCLYAPEHHKKIQERLVESEEELEKELLRFEKVVEEAAKDLDQWAGEVAAKIGKAESEIFTAQKHILLDPTVLTMVRNDIRKRKRNAEAAIDEVYRAYEDSFEKMGNEYLRDRGRDIGDIRKRLLDRLKDSKDGFVCEGQSRCRRGFGRIIVTEELTPQMIAKTDFTRVKGFVTEHGGRASHAAIIARALGIPAVSGIHGLFDWVQCGAPLYIDGDAGTITLNPTDVQLRAADLSASEAKIAKEEPPRDSPPGMEVLANISLVEELPLVRELRADGVGLFRTEFLFIKSGRELSEEEQYTIYSTVVAQMEGRPVTFRLVDAGGDKPLPFIAMEAEANPYLGWRGSRFLLGNPALLRNQIRALARASAKGPIKILFPMVVDLNQWRALRAFAEEALSDIALAPGRVQMGPMFEVPSAYFDADAILKEADFASLGTNDLIQYLFAVDRNNEHVLSDYNPDHPVLWKVLSDFASLARVHGKRLSVCGEMASIPGMANRLREIGVTSLSVSPRFVPVVRSEWTMQEGTKRSA